MPPSNDLRIGLSLEPLDVLFFRDGRPFEAATQAASGLPVPQTLAGALRTWLLRKAGCDFEKLASALKPNVPFSVALGQSQEPELAPIAQLRFRGPWFALNGRPLVPVPASLHKVKETGEVVRLCPLKSPSLPGWSNKDNHGLRPLWGKRDQPTERAEGYLTLEGLQEFLAGGIPGKANIREAHDLFDFDRRVGIGVQPDALIAAEGQIYAVSLLALKNDSKTRVTLYAEVECPDEANRLLPGQGVSVPIALGGEGRRVALTRTDPVAWPEPAPKDGRVMLFLTAPGFFGGPLPPGIFPIAAAVPGYTAVSGWDLAKGGPKPTRFAAPAGSVYFLEKPLDSFPHALGSQEDTALGWGACLTGVWDYE